MDGDLKDSNSTEKDSEDEKKIKMKEQYVLVLPIFLLQLLIIVLFFTFGKYPGQENVVVKPERTGNIPEHSMDFMYGNRTGINETETDWEIRLTTENDNELLFNALYDETGLLDIKFNVMPKLDVSKESPNESVVENEQQLCVPYVTKNGSKESSNDSIVDNHQQKISPDITRKNSSKESSNESLVKNNEQLTIPGDKQDIRDKRSKLIEASGIDILVEPVNITLEHTELHPQNTKPLLRENPIASSSLRFSTKNSISDVHVMVFVGFGFLMTFLKKYGFSAVGFNMLLAAISLQLAILVRSVLEMVSNNEKQFEINVDSLIQGDLTAAIILITFGALLGLTNLQQLTILAIFETLFACGNFYLFEQVFKAEDPGGSITVHTFGAFFGIGASIALGKLEKETESGGIGSALGSRLPSNSPLTKLNESSYSSDLFAMIGTLFLFIFWPTFNAICARSEESYDRAIINTFLSITASVITSFLFSILVHKSGKIDMVHVQNSVLSGGVGIGAIATANLLPGVAVLVGTVMGMISVLGYKYITPALEERGVLDTCGVINLHGIPGLISGALSILYCFVPWKLSVEEKKMVYDAGRADKDQAMYQLYGLLSTFAIAFFSGCIMGYIIRKLSTSLKQAQAYRDDRHWHVPE